MCVGDVERLEAAWDDGGTPAGRLAGGRVVSLAFVPGARPGDHVLVHLGIPVEVLDPAAAREALALRASPIAPSRGGMP